jgi:hypothetical protein
MRRIGYDADTGRYLFQDSDGSVWQGEEGAEFGEMTKGERDLSSENALVVLQRIEVDGIYTT